ncbi:MAG: DUF3575 domain-containing protein [Rikenellaceae bacterium]
MKRKSKSVAKWRYLLSLALSMVASATATAQNCEVKLNALAGAVAIFNPSVEVGLSDNSALSFDYVGAFAEESYLHSGYPLILAMGLFGYRQYITSESNTGLYIGGDFGLNMFRMNKNIIPLVANDRGNNYDVGYGYLLGLSVGYKYPITERLSVEASLSGGWQYTRHEVYSMDGNRFISFNASGEWTPYKAGIYLNYRL